MVGRNRILVLSLALVCVLVLSSIAAHAHKSPVIEYTKVGNWRAAFSYIPRQPVVDEPILITEQVSHIGLVGAITQNVTMLFSVYQDDSVNDWYGGKQYKHPDWQLVSSEPGQPMPGEENKFSSAVVITRPGNYFVTVDIYGDGQLIGQDMRSIDVEQRTIGPLFAVFSVAIIGVVLYGVKRGVL